MNASTCIKDFCLNQNKIEIHRLVALILIIHLVPIGGFAQSIIYDDHKITKSNDTCTFVFEVIDESDTSQLLVLNDTLNHSNGSVNIVRQDSLNMNNLCLNFTGLRSDLAGNLMSGILFESDTFKIYTTSTSIDNHFLVFSNTNSFIRIGHDGIKYPLLTDSIIIYPDTSILEFGFLLSQVFTESDSGNLQVLLKFLEPVKVLIDTSELYSTNLLLETNIPFDLFKSARLHWNNFEYTIGIDDLKSNLNEFSLDPIISEWQCNRIVTIYGEGFDHIQDIIVGNHPLYFELIDEFEIELHLPASLSDTIVLHFDTHLGNYYSDPIEVLIAWTPTSLKSVNVLYEDEEVVALVKWSEADSSEATNYIIHLSIVDTSTSQVVGIHEDSLQDLHFKVYDNLSRDSTYLVELYQWDDYYTEYILVDYLFFNANNDGGENDQMVVSEDLMAHLGSWGEVADTITYVEYVQGFDLHSIELRSFLQAINGGKGFSISAYPWYSNYGPIYSRGPGVSPPGFPDGDPNGDDDDPQNSPCLCKLILNSYYADEWVNTDFVQPGSIKYEKGWYKPIVNKYNPKNDKYYKVLHRVHKAGASVYRELETFKRSRDVVTQTYNYKSDSGNSDMQGKGTNGTISIVYECWQNPNANGSTTRCVLEDCIVPSVFNYSYCTLIKTPKHKFYQTWLTNIAKSIMMDGVFVLTKTEDAAPHDLIDIKIVSQEMYCEKGWNPEWWKAFAGLLASTVPLLDFSEGGVSIDLSELTENQVQQILDSLINIFTISFVTKDNINCEFALTEECIEGSSATFKSFPFDLVPYKKRSFVVASTQSVYNRVLRAKVYSELKSDFHMSILIGRDSYGGPESPIETCCIDRRGAYVVGSQEHKWKGSSNKDNSKEEDYFSSGWGRTFGALIQAVENMYSGQLPALGLEDYHYFSKWLDEDFCSRYDFPSAAIWSNDTSETSLMVALDDKDFINVDYNISIFPNPGTNVIYLKNSSDEAIEEVILTDVYGRVIFKRKLMESTLKTHFPVEIQGLIPGKYFLGIMVGSRRINYPVVKQ